MANFDVYLDLDPLLTDPTIGSAIDRLADQVAANASHTTSAGEEIPVKVDHYTTDRRAASVTLAHPAGIAVQIKHGVLTKAAAAAGLEVRAR